MTYSDYRRLARENLRGNWGLSIVAGVLAILLGGLLSGNSFIPQFSFRIDGQDISSFWNLLNLVTAGTGLSFLKIGSLLALVSFIIGGTIQLGYAKFLLNQYNKANFQLQDLFSCFDRFGQGFAQHFLRSLYTLLWSFLFIIPGIVKSYAYAMTPFIMAENPELSANEAIAASVELMDGHKGELFTLDLTFIGWGILAALSCNNGHLALNPYHNAAYAVFYKGLTANK